MTAKYIRLRLNVVDPEVTAALLKLKEGRERELFALEGLRRGVLSMSHGRTDDPHAVSSRFLVSGQETAPRSAGEVVAIYPDLADLSRPLTEWLEARMLSHRIEWPYHPRSNELGDFVRRQVMRDLLRACPAFALDAEQGLIACDLNLRLVGQTGQSRKLDLVLGPPAAGRLAPGDPSAPLRKAQISAPHFALEVKACMTAHAKAIPRLIGELQQSIGVIKTTNPDALAFAVVVVNASKRFTSPLNKPGPNIHDQPRAVKSVIDAVLKRIPLGPRSYSAVAIAVIDFDNERVARALALTPWVPLPYRYIDALRWIAATYRSLS